MTSMPLEPIHLDLIGRLTEELAGQLELTGQDPLAWHDEAIMAVAMAADMMARHARPLQPSTQFILARRLIALS